MKKSLKYMGVTKIYSYGSNVAASSWKEVKDKKKDKVKRDMSSLKGKIEKLMNKEGKLRTSLFIKFMFTLMRSAQKKSDWNPIEREYWQKKGWLEDKRPW